MTIWLGGTQGSRTQTEELVLRFKTARAAGLLLLTSAESNSPDRLEISLVAGRVRASVRLGEREKVCKDEFVYHVTSRPVGNLATLLVDRNGC